MVKTCLRMHNIACIRTHVCTYTPRASPGAGHRGRSASGRSPKHRRIGQVHDLYDTDDTRKSFGYRTTLFGSEFLD